MVVVDVDKIVAVVGEDKAEDELLAGNKAGKEVDNVALMVTEDIDNLLLM